jgi:hypothetical protein
MSERLDRIEKIVESNAKAIEALANQASEHRQLSETRDSQLKETLDRLANIVLRIANRQDDHEDRIVRVEQK